MRRINTSDGLYHNADVLAGIQGTVVDADALNSIQEEIITVITDAGMELNASSNTQLRDAIAAITGAGVEWGAIKNKPATFPSTIPLVAGLSDALGLLAPKASPALTGIPTAPTAAAGTNTTQIASTAFVTGVANNLQTALDGKSNVGHGHTISDVANLQATLDGKSNVGHGHVISDIANLQPSLDGKVAKAGDTMTGPLVINSDVTGAVQVTSPKHAGFNLNRTNPVGSWISYLQGSVNGTARWQLVLGNQDGESGANNGSNFVVNRYSDVGVGSVALRILRNTGDADLYGSLTIQAASTQWAGLSLTNLSAGGHAWRFLSIGSAWNGNLPAGSLVIWDDNGGSRLWFSTAGNATFAGSVTANGGFQNSDRRLKKNIAKRSVLRGLALKLARNFSEWDLRDGGRHDVGLIAQLVEKVAPWYVKKSECKRKIRAIDKAGIALEASMDNALSIHELLQQHAALSRRIEKMERRNK